MIFLVIFKCGINELKLFIILIEWLEMLGGCNMYMLYVNLKVYYICD